jgi:hypothetical protein
MSARGGLSIFEFFSWLGGVAVTVAAAATWAYGTFETKEAMTTRREMFMSQNNSRLDRIEAKIDFLVEQIVNRKGK